MADGLRLELRQEVIDRTIAFIDHFKQLASRGLLFRAEAKPIEAVIPNLTNLVEQTCLALFFRGFDRLRQARALEACLRNRSEEHTSELQSLMRTSYAVICLKKKKNS